MTTRNPGDHENRTEIIHDVDYPLDVPGSTAAGVDDGATTAFPAADPGYSQFAESGGYDVAAPLPFGDQPATIEPARRDQVGPRGTADLGLFLLRVTVGVLLASRGLQTLFGLFGGPGLDGAEQTLADAGFSSARVLAIAGGSVELVAGVMLVVGLATPVAAAGLLGLVVLGVLLHVTGPEPTVLFGQTTPGLEPAVLYAAALLAILFAGPGRWSADRRWQWSHRPRFSGLVWLLVVAVVAGVVWYFLNGGNPLTSVTDSAPVTTG